MSSSEEDMSWIEWYCSLRGNEYLCQIDEDYITDKFNLTGLNEMVPLYRYAIQQILDCYEPEEDDDKEQIQKSAEHLYGYIHARYIMTNRGLQQMVEKWRNGDFQACQRAYCNNQQMLPIGTTDKPFKDFVKLYCPKCDEIYTPMKQRYQNLDGAFFGTGFPHMLFMVYPQLRNKPNKEQFVPRMYGFKIHDTALEVQWKKGKELEDQRKKAENAVYQATKKVQKMHHYIQNSQKNNNNKSVSSKVTSDQTLNNNNNNTASQDNTINLESKTASQNTNLSQKLSSNNSNNPLINELQNMEIITHENPQNLIWAHQQKHLKAQNSIESNKTNPTPPPIIQNQPPSYQSTQISGNNSTQQTAADYSLGC